MWALTLVILVAALLAYVSLSDSVEYVHVGSSGCFVAHAGWHFHFQCGAPAPPLP